MTETSIDWSVPATIMLRLNDIRPQTTPAQIEARYEQVQETYESWKHLFSRKPTLKRPITASSKMPFYRKKQVEQQKYMPKVDVDSSGLYKQLVTNKPLPRIVKSKDPMPITKVRMITKRKKIPQVEYIEEAFKHTSEITQSPQRERMKFSETTKAPSIEPLVQLQNDWLGISPIVSNRSIEDQLAAFSTRVSKEKMAEQFPHLKILESQTPAEPPELLETSGPIVPTPSQIVLNLKSSGIRAPASEDTSSEAQLTATAPVRPGTTQSGQNKRLRVNLKSADMRRRIRPGTAPYKKEKYKYDHKPVYKLAQAGKRCKAPFADQMPGSKVIESGEYGIMFKSLSHSTLNFSQLARHTYYKQVGISSIAIKRKRMKTENIVEKDAFL